MLGLILVAVGVVALVTFWDKIRDWLMNTVLDSVERLLGPVARTGFTKAIVEVDKIIQHGKRMVRKVARVIMQEPTSQAMREVRIIEYESQADFTLQELEEMDKKGILVQTFAAGGMA